MKRIRTIATFIVVLMSLTARAEEKAPVAPVGYAWVHSDMIDSDILKPNEWFVNQGKGFFTISKLKMAPGVDYKAALFVNVTALPTNGPMAPKISALLNQITLSLTNKVIVWNGVTNKITISDRKLSTNGVFKVLTYHNRDQGRVDATSRQYWFLNQKTGKAITIWFEAPTAEWEAYWKIAAPCLENLRLNERF